MVNLPMTSPLLLVLPRLPCLSLVSPVAAVAAVEALCGVWPGLSGLGHVSVAEVYGITAQLPSHANPCPELLVKGSELIPWRISPLCRSEVYSIRGH